MKTIIFSVLMVTFLSIGVFAKDKITQLRKLNCTGAVTGAEGSVDIVLNITDYKVTYTEDGQKFTDYGTKASITDPQNPSQKLEAVTTNSGEEDPQPLRDEKRDGAWAGLSFFDLHRKGSAGGKMNRDGLLALGSMEIPADKTKRVYEVGLTMGEVTDKDAKGYNGSVNCDLIPAKN